MIRSLDLSEAQKEAPVKWTIAQVGWKIEWDKVTFSDEKKFNFESLDRFKCYWKDLITEPNMFFSRPSGVWSTRKVTM